MMTPISSMPSWVVPLTYANPLRYFVELHRSVLLRGASLSDVAHDVGALAAMGAGLLLFAASRFRRTMG
jgi:ABC-2 type transport system permease protein